MSEKHDRFTTSVCITANRPLTRKQWQEIHSKIAAAVENIIAESEELTEKIGHVHLGSPWKRPITNTTDLRIDNFSGWHYIVYDKYGHVSTDSATYDTRGKAMKELEDDITPREGYDDPAAPYTAVLFNVPSTVTIKGEMWKLIDGGIRNVEK